jgi:hypothetical protein
VDVNTRSREHRDRATPPHTRGAVTARIVQDACGRMQDVHGQCHKHCADKVSADSDAYNVSLWRAPLNMLLASW